MKRETFIKQAQVLRNKRFANHVVTSIPEIRNGVVKTTISPKLVIPSNKRNILSRTSNKSTGCSGCRRKPKDAG